MRYAIARNERAAERRGLDAAFGVRPGSKNAARAAIERPIQYDRERLFIESD